MHNTRRGVVIGVVLATIASFFALVVTNLLPGAQAESAGSSTVDRRVASGSIAAGYMNSCAIADSGALRCWGGADMGVLGQGTGVPAQDDTQYDIGDNEDPATVPAIDLGPGRTARSISLRYKHVCAVLDNGSVRCWGNGQGDVDTDLEGVLGTLGKKIVGDDEKPSSVPPVDLGAGRTAKQVAAGWLQTCAILDTDQVKCWGQNNGGQLGLGNSQSPVAAADSGTLDLGGSAAAISSGRMHTCALLTNGSVKCWGYNNYGQLGLGNTDNVGDNETPASVGAVDLGPGRTATAIAVGYEHSCAILDNGQLRCWGRNDSGQLGLGNITTLGDDEAVSSVAPVDLGAGRKAVNVSLGYDTTCVVLDDGATRCWGSNHIAQLGLGADVTPLPGELPAPPDDVNYHAMLGDNELPTSVAPIGLEPATAVATGTYHSCALLQDQTLKCWGAGNNGRTGHGNESRIGDDESPSASDPVNVGSAVGVPVTTTSTTTSTSTSTTAAPTTSTTSTTAPAVVTGSTTTTTTAPPTTVPPTTAPPTTAPPTTAPPAAAPADTTPPYLRMWRGSPVKVGKDGRVCVFLTSDEVAITAFSIKVPGKGEFRSAVIGVGPTYPQFLCITLPKSARPTKATSTTFTAAGLDRAVNMAFDQATVVLTK